MPLVCLDTHYFKWGILKKCKTGQEEKIQQSVEFFDKLDKDRAVIIVPTPVVTELLMGATQEEQVKILKALEENFKVAEFSLIAAANAAHVWNHKKEHLIQPLIDSGESPRVKLKVDIQILGTAMAEECTMLYTEDGPLRKLAEGYMPTSTMPQVSQMTLFPPTSVEPNASERPAAQSPSAG